MKAIIDARTYDDVLLMPDFAEVLAADVDISTQFTRNIRLNAPVCSSAMNTVTHSELAIQMALLGGIGILDRHMPIHLQCDHVSKVKRSMNKVITKPWTLTPKNTVAEARNLMRDKAISGIPIVDTDGYLRGIITIRDLQLITENTMQIGNVMTIDNLVTAPTDIDPLDAQKIFNSAHVEKLLLVDDNNLLKGLMTLKDTTKRNKFPNATLDDGGQLRVGAAVGVSGDFYERAQALRDAGADIIVIDVAHGHSKYTGDALDRLKNISGVDIIAGNIATAQGAKFLYDRGADAVKVGVGPGSICTTRVVTGVGVPQFSAIWSAYQGIGDAIPIIADGGIRYSGDIPKAIAAGASSVMIGSLFAGTDESPGKKILRQGRMYKSYHGMGSPKVLNDGGDRYGSKAIAEGIEGEVAYKGPLAFVFDQLVGGLRKGMEDTGCASLEELKTKTTVIRITDAGRRESHPHDVIITNEAPNYQVPD